MITVSAKEKHKAIKSIREEVGDGGDIRRQKES